MNVRLEGLCQQDVEKKSGLDSAACICGWASTAILEA